jgi:hypothetical protein
MVTKKDIKKSTSSLNLAFKAKTTGQLTENSALFEFNIKSVNVEVSLGLIFNKSINPNFDVLGWYNSKSDIMKIRISDLMNNVTFNGNGQVSITNNAQTTQRAITTDPVKNEDPNILAYFFEITYNK